MDGGCISTGVETQSWTELFATVGHSAQLGDECLELRSCGALWGRRVTISSVRANVPTNITVNTKGQEIEDIADADMVDAMVDAVDQP